MHHVLGQVRRGREVRQDAARTEPGLARCSSLFTGAAARRN